LRAKAFNEDTFGIGLLSTLQIGTEQDLSHGYAPFMVSTGQMYSDFGTSLRLLHYSDTSLEPGVSDANESAYHFVIAHVTRSRLRRILKAAKANPGTSWNVPALEELLKTSPTQKDYSEYKSDPRKGMGGQDEGKAYQIITRFETGKGGQFVTFCKQYSEAPLRVIDNKSKWGYPRVQYLVIDPDALVPFGISRVRLASPNQNFMNIYLASIASMLLLNSAPPVFKRGMFNGPTPLKRNAVWESNDRDADITLKTLDNGALSQFVPMSQQFSSQIQNIMGGQTMTVNSGSKASVFGKTAPGVQAGQEFLNTETNQITKILENFLRQYALVALDTIISEKTGTEMLILDDEAMDKINQIAPGTVGEDHKIEINWQEFYEKIEEWKVDVDVSLSPDELKDQKRADLQDMLVVLAQNAQTLGPGAMQKVQEITDMLLQDKVPSMKTMSETMPQMMPGQEMMPQVMPPQM
jgi:hypothetical protein